MSEVARERQEIYVMEGADVEGQPVEMLMEQRLERMGQSTVIQAKRSVISNNEQYQEAGTFLVELKQKMKSVKDFFAEPKSKAKAAHQSIVDREKAMLEPLNEAERIVKRSMVVYQNAVEEARRKAEAEARKRQQEEAERLMQEAIKAEKAGNEAAAEVTMAMAEMVEDMQTPMPSAISAPKAAGVSVRKVWKARVVDASKVPIFANGLEIRPINMSALDQIARLTKGTAQIPGVELFEDSVMSARAY